MIIVFVNITYMNMTFAMQYQILLSTTINVYLLLGNKPIRPAFIG